MGGCNFAAIHLTKGPKPEASRIHVIHVIHVIISSSFAYVLWDTKKPQISLGFCHSANPLRPFQTCPSRGVKFLETSLIANVMAGILSKNKQQYSNATLPATKCITVHHNSCDEAMCGGICYFLSKRFRRNQKSPSKAGNRHCQGYLPAVVKLCI